MYRLLLYANRDDKGSTLVVTILVLVILSILGTAALILTNTELLIARNMNLKTKAFYLAEGAVNEAISSIESTGAEQSWILTPAVSDDSLSSQSFWGDNATHSSLMHAKYVADLKTSEGKVICYGRAYIENAEKIVSVGLRKELFTGYALFSNGGLELKDNTVTHGDVFSNGYMELKDGSYVYGDLKSHSTISENDTYNSTKYSINQGLPREDIPEIDWEKMESNAEFEPGSKTFSGNESGIYYVHGEVSFDENATFTNKISIISEGKIETNTGLEMSCVDGYPALASMSDIEINSGSGLGDTEIKGLVYGFDKVEIKGDSDINIYGSVVTNATENNALELKDESGILTVEFNEDYLRKNEYIQEYWKDI